MKKHTFDPLSFVAGVIFLMIAAAPVLNTGLDYELSGWVLPASVLVLGVGLLAASLRGMGSEDNRQQTTDDRPEPDEEHGLRTTDNGSEPEGEALVDNESS